MSQQHNDQEDQNLNDASDTEEFSTQDPMDEQFEKLAEILAQSQSEPEIVQSSIDEDPSLREALLIEEDQLLEKSERENAESELPPSTDVTLELDQTEIESCLEALLFLSEKPLSVEKLRQLIGPEYNLSLFSDALLALQKRYEAVCHGIELIEVAGGYQLRTKPGRSRLAKKLVQVQTQKLSSGAMETLAIIAYKQPLMKEEVDKIRGVDSSYFIRTLLNRKLIKISGRSELPGRPILYSTTSEFLEIFGLKDLSVLPSLRELESLIPTSQAGNPEEEDPRVKEMRRLVQEMKLDRTSALHYNPKEDDIILKQIREKVASIPTSTPTLDEMKAAEILAQQPPVPESEAPPPAPIDGI